MSYKASRVLEETPESFLQHTVEVTSVSNINASITWGSIKIVVKLIHVLPNYNSAEVPVFAAFYKNREVRSVSLFASSLLG